MFKRNHDGNLERLSFKQNVTAFKVGGGVNPYTSGYGERVRTDWVVNHNGRLQRVYCVLYGNSGTLWINVRGRKVLVDIEEV